MTFTGGLALTGLIMMVVALVFSLGADCRYNNLHIPAWAAFIAMVGCWLAAVWLEVALT